MFKFIQSQPDQLLFCFVKTSCTEARYSGKWKRIEIFFQVIVYLYFLFIPLKLVSLSIKIIHVQWNKIKSLIIKKMMENRIAIQGKYSADYLQKCHLRAIIDNNKNNSCHFISFGEIFNMRTCWTVILQLHITIWALVIVSCRRRWFILCVPILNNRSTVLSPQA